MIEDNDFNAVKTEDWKNCWTDEWRGRCEHRKSKAESECAGMREGYLCVWWCGLVTWVRAGHVGWCGLVTWGARTWLRVRIDVRGAYRLGPGSLAEGECVGLGG